MALNIPLYDGWSIRTDSSNYILSKLEGGRENSQGFYVTLEGAIRGFISKKIKGFDSTSIFGLLQAIKSLEQSLNKALQPLNLVVMPINSGVDSK